MSCLSARLKVGEDAAPSGAGAKSADVVLADTFAQFEGLVGVGVWVFDPGVTHEFAEVLLQTSQK